MLFPLNTRGADPGLRLAGTGKRCRVGCPPVSCVTRTIPDEDDTVGARASAPRTGTPSSLLYCTERLVPLDLPSLLLWDPVALQHSRWTAEHLVKIGCLVWVGFSVVAEGMMFKCLKS